MASPLLRYQLFLSVGFAFLAAWKAALSHLDSLKSYGLASPNVTERAVTFLPVWAILALGLYALLSVLYRVATFGDCPEAANELAGQIAEAKEKLKAAGFVF